MPGREMQEEQRQQLSRLQLRANTRLHGGDGAPDIVGIVACYAVLVS